MSYDQWPFPPAGAGMMPQYNPGGFFGPPPASFQTGASIMPPGFGPQFPPFQQYPGGMPMGMPQGAPFPGYPQQPPVMRPSVGGQGQVTAGGPGYSWGNVPPPPAPPIGPYGGQPQQGAPYGNQYPQAGAYYQQGPYGQQPQNNQPFPGTTPSATASGRFSAPPQYAPERHITPQELEQRIVTTLLKQKFKEDEARSVINNVLILELGIVRSALEQIKGDPVISRQNAHFIQDAEKWIDYLKHVMGLATIEAYTQFRFQHGQQWEEIRTWLLTQAAKLFKD